MKWQKKFQKQNWNLIKEFYINSLILSQGNNFEEVIDADIEKSIEHLELKFKKL